MSMQKTYQFIKDAGHYFIATVDKDQPEVRPFGTIHIFEGSYIQMGRKKNVAQRYLLTVGGTLRLEAERVDSRVRRPG